jgi:O-6-methylguanine DNA methyltransferase
MENYVNTNKRETWVGLLPSTPLGPIWLAASHLGLVAVQVGGEIAELEADLRRKGFSIISRDDARLADAVQQLAAYLDGERIHFDISIDWTAMTDFQRRALQMTFEIPYGETRTYGQIARALGAPHAARAVGRAQATNPMPLVVPCHRVLGADGKLHGYGSGEGLPTKAWLLQLEASS